MARPALGALPLLCASALATSLPNCLDVGDGCWKSRPFTFADIPLSHYRNNDQCSVPLPPGESVIHVVHFDTELGRDILTVDGIPYSGEDGPHHVPVRNSLTWRTDASGTKANWHLCLAPTAVSCSYTFEGFPWFPHCRVGPGKEINYPDVRDPAECQRLCQNEACCQYWVMYFHHGCVLLYDPLGHDPQNSLTRQGTHGAKFCFTATPAYFTDFPSRTSSHSTTGYPTTFFPTTFPTAGDPTAFPTAETLPTAPPTGSPVLSPTAAPTVITDFPSTSHPTGFPMTGFPNTHIPTSTQSPVSTDGPVRISSCAAGAGRYTVNGVEQDSPCNSHGDRRHVDYVSDFNGIARVYTCSRNDNHHFVLCTCRGAVCGESEEPATCFVPTSHAAGCVGMLRGAAFSSDGTKVFFACSKEVRVCRVDLSNRNAQPYSDCQVVEGAGCPRWAAIRGIAARPRPGRGDLLAVVCTDSPTWKTRACSLDADNMRMQPGRACIKGGPEALCQGLGRPAALAFSPDGRLLAPCGSGYSYARLVGGIVQGAVHTAYNGTAPCPTETKAIANSGTGRAVVACGPDGVRHCLIRYD